MVKFSADLRDLEAAAALEVLGRVPETQRLGTEVSTLEMSTDSEVTFRKVLGCQGYVPPTLDVMRVAVKVPLAFHTPL